MTIDVYIEGWEIQENPKRYERFVDVYPPLSNDDFKGEGHPIDSEGFYLKETTDYTYPTMNITARNLQALFDSIGVTYDSWEGHLKANEVSRVLRKTLKALNTESSIQKGVEPGHTQGNFISFGRDAEYMKTRLSDFCELLRFAVQENKGIYWL